MLVDTHSHIVKHEFNNIDEIIKESLKVNVKKIVNVSENLETSVETIELSKKYPSVLYATIGVHPNNAYYLSEEEIKNIEKIIIENKIIAIGEIGLDYHYENYDKSLQIKVFETFLSLAEKYNLPVLIHSRDATKDTIDILKKYKVKGIIHCFSGSMEIAKEYIKMGFYLGIGGVVTFKNANLREVIKNIDLSYIVLETDAPFLAPHPYRGKENKPSYIPIIAQEIATLKNIFIEEVEKITTENATRIFDF